MAELGGDGPQKIQPPVFVFLSVWIRAAWFQNQIGGQMWQSW